MTSLPFLFCGQTSEADGTIAAPRGSISRRRPAFRLQNVMRKPPFRLEPKTLGVLDKDNQPDARVHRSGTGAGTSDAAPANAGSVPESLDSGSVARPKELRVMSTFHELYPPISRAVASRAFQVLILQQPRP